MRLPHLPAKFYETILLKKIGNTIRKLLLKVDACTSSTLRGHYARLCVQIPPYEPVLRSIQIGKHKQKTLYEGEGYLCTNCGRFGHVQVKCPHQRALLLIRIPPLKILASRRQRLKNQCQNGTL